MGPKKEKKEKKKKVKEKPPKILKSDYLAKIADRNAELVAARKRIQKVEDVYYSTEKKYEQTEEDLADIIQYLQHEIEEKELKIAAFDEKITIYKKEIAKNDKYYNSILSTLEAEYEGKEKELHDQYQQNAVKLSAFEELRQHREEYFKKKEQISQKMKEMVVRQVKEMYDVDKQDNMKKEIEKNINKLITDFKQATDTEIIINKKILIKDNIALGNTLTCTQEIFERARDSYCKIYGLEKQYRYNAELLKEEHHMAMEKYLKQVNRIENLLKSHEKLFNAIKMCEKLIRENRRLRREIAEKECILKEKEMELNYLQKVLKEHEETFNTIKDLFNMWRKNVVNLEMRLYEAAKRAKQGIDIENITSLLDENGLPVKMAKEEQEEALKELKFKTRETAIEEITEVLRSELHSNTEMQLQSPFSEFYLNSNNASSLSNIRHASLNF